MTKLVTVVTLRTLPKFALLMLQQQQGLNKRGRQINESSIGTGHVWSAYSVHK